MKKSQLQKITTLIPVIHNKETVWSLLPFHLHIISFHIKY